MLALRSSVVSLYEVSEIVPDECFLARDLVRRGEPIRIMERRATHDLKPWDRIVARIVTLGTRTEMTGGVLRLDREASEAALKAFRRGSQAARKQAGRFARELGRPQANSLLAEILSDTEILRGSAFLFTNIWLDDMLTRALNPTLPQICNTDGDELVITKVSYPLKTAASAGAIRCALAAIPGLRAESNTFWRWIAPQKQPASPGSSSHTMITTVEDGSLLLGTLELKHDKLVLEANSRKRAERGRALIAPAIGGLVGEPLIEAATAAELIVSRPSRTSARWSSGLAPDEERAVIHANLDQHYVNLLDQPVPALGNVSPRRAAQTKKGREKLVAWLKYLENAASQYAAGSPMAGYDMRWMWQELGVTDLRC
jgi:hypothetical protein